jgi:hypothetical protein
MLFPVQSGVIVAFALLFLLGFVRLSHFSPNSRAVRLLEKDPERARAMLQRAAAAAAVRGDKPNVPLMNLAVAHLRLGDLAAARATLEKCIAQPGLTGLSRKIVMSSFALTYALLGELDAADRCRAEGYTADGAALWVLEARRGRRPVPPAPGSIPSAWCRSLFDVVDAFARRESGYRGEGTRLQVAPGLHRALTSAWPEMAVFLGPLP